MTKTYTVPTYPEFEHAPATLNKYIEASGIFTIMLKTGAIVHFSPGNAEAFRKWLTEHSIPDIRTQHRNLQD
ncbi:hypothetical protein [Niabella drilacis]|uniref:Uncharacterized protein n=1 Tax=Niabella drilacis (strain DSM 25811 / CCM 8410 / CCUG 62505 / LMG 26954 / E90) TaxID=1285928 RepID=A0A1G7BY62_NIADE|nr:hypothetical protein [Niabella drilacis]SDE32031.1 hypothetical protein SAMN04487894_1355 [Niabella drilacis]